MSFARCYFQFHAGDRQTYEGSVTNYNHLSSWLVSNAASYGLPPAVSDLDEAGQETVKSLYKSTTGRTIESFAEPPSLALPRLGLLVSTSPGLQKTVRNFIDLCTDSRKLSSKQSIKGSKPPLRYSGTRVFRVERDFCCQGGDVTMNDGSGGESIYGGSFNDEKEGLKAEFKHGSLAMANSGKNSNTSQWFICLCKDPARLKKLNGKYVVFGTVDMQSTDSMACLERLNELGQTNGQPTTPIWIDSCGQVP